MSCYSDEMIETVLDTHAAVAVELVGGDVLVGYLIRTYGLRPNTLTVLPLDARQHKVHFRKSYIKQIMYLHTRYILPKTKDAKRSRKHLTITELADYLGKHGYELV